MLLETGEKNRTYCAFKLKPISICSLNQFK